MHWPTLALAVSLAQPPAPLPDPVDPAFIEQHVRGVIQSRDTPGCVVGVVVGDRLAYVEAFGVRDVETGEPMRVDTPFQIGSITKAFTATLTCLLRDRGLLRLDDPVERFLPADARIDHRLEDGPAITLGHLLTHTSGLPSNPPNRRNRPDGPSVMLPYDVDDLYAGLRATSLAAPVGARVAYSNYGIGLLGHALERAAERPFESMLKDELLTPLGMNDSTITPSPDQESHLASCYWPAPWPRVARPRWEFGEVSAFGGMISTVPDLARFAKLYLGTHPRAGGDAPLLAASAVDELITPRRLINDDWTAALGLVWWIHHTDLGVDVVSHGGEVDGYGGHLAFAPRHGVAVIVLTNVGGDMAGALARPIVDEVIRTAHEQRATLHREAREGQDRSAALRQLAKRAPRDRSTAYWLATSLYHAAEWEDAEAAFVHAAVLGFERPTSYYNAAACAARRGANDDAFRWLRRAREVGFRNRQHAAIDPDLSTLHDDLRWTTWPGGE